MHNAMAQIGHNKSVGSKKSGLIFFCICCHLGDSSKHLRRPKVKHHDEESSPNDALTPKKGKTRVAGKVRRYLWVCPLTPPPPHPIFLPLAFVK